MQQNAVQTSTPQKSFSMLPGPNRYFQNYEIEPIADGKQSHSTCSNTNGISDGSIIPQSSKVAARRRRPQTEKLQTITCIPEQKRKTTKPNCKIRGNTIEADLIEIDDNHVENFESNANINSKRISTMGRNNEEHENNFVRKLCKTNYFDNTSSDDSCSFFDKNEQLTVDVDVHRVDELTPINLASSLPASASISNADKLLKDATRTVDTSRLTHEHNRTIQMPCDKLCDRLQSSCLNDAANGSCSLLNNVAVRDQISSAANPQQIDNITISSASFNITPIPSNCLRTTTASISNGHRLTKAKTKVGFNTPCLVHEKSTGSENMSNEYAKIVMKGGKWRRTIVGIRKNKSSQRKFIV